MMAGRFEGWKVGLWTVIGVFLSSIPTVQLAAQVGHDPTSSPYHDIPLHSGFFVLGGHLSHDRGRAGAGPSNASTVALRYEMPAGHSMGFQFTLGYLSGDRFVLDPRADSTSPFRKQGPFPTDLVLAEVGLQLRLTGAKSWHGLVPYAGTGLGLMFDAHSPGDTTLSGYNFGTKISLSGSTGVRWYASRHLVVNADLRAQMWRLKYPLSFHAPAPDGSLVVAPIDPLSDWTAHPWVSIGLGWIF